MREGLIMLAIKEIPVSLNISMLKSIKPRWAPQNSWFKDYYLSWDTVRNMKYIKDWLSSRMVQEIREFADSPFFARVHFNSTGKITECAVSSRCGSFVYMGFGEEFDYVIEKIFNDNKEVVLK